MAIQELFNFEAFPILETERLRLREITPDDVEGIFQIRGDYEVTRYNTGAAYSHIEQAGALIANLRSAFEDKRTIRWGITLKGDDTVIGMCGYNYWVRIDYRGSIGYDLARAYWGRGIMPEAIHAIVDFGFTRMGLNRIEADATVDNQSSIRVLEKVGFGREGIQREQYFEEGTFYDLMLFSLLRRDYFK
jgi:[ribosomal protein S5]-alanine N-acetyltransferase